MSKERIAQLNEQARKIWPDAEVEQTADSVYVNLMRDGHMVDCVFLLAHPRGLDVLEVALSALLEGEGGK